MWPLGFTHVIPKAFIAAVIGSEKNTGSTRSTISPETSRKFLLFSRGISALRAPLSIATCNGSASDRIGFMFPWMLRSPRIEEEGFADLEGTELLLPAWLPEVNLVESVHAGQEIEPITIRDSGEEAHALS
jgi:hypothetical protein